MRTHRILGGELGLLSLAFHPNFTKAGSPGENIFYTYYASPSPQGKNIAF